MTKVSVIMTACNQGEQVCRTVGEAIKSLDDMPHEVIVIDDQSTDGCCHDLPRETLIIPTDYRLGVSGARRLGAEQASGELLLFSDPHCIYPGDSLRRIIKLAASNWAVVQPPTDNIPNSTRKAWGGRWIRNERGLALGRATRGWRHQVLINTIYCCRRDVYEAFHGWPLLPGCWGYSEQAMSLILIRAGIPIIVADTAFCSHLMDHPDGQLRFRCSQHERAFNGHIVHNAFFPQTYNDVWRPILIANFGLEHHIDRWLGSEESARLQRHVQSISAITEAQFYRAVFGMQAVPCSFDATFVRQQQERSEAMGNGVNIDRLDSCLKWFEKVIPGCIKGRSILDVGTREGTMLDVVKSHGARHGEGIEILEDQCLRGQRKGRIIRRADMRAIPDPPDVWDVVLCVHSLEHVPDPKVVLSEVVRVLRPGGWLLIVVPRESEPLSEYAHNFAFPDSSALKHLVRNIDGLDYGSRKLWISPTGRDSPEIRLAIRKR